MLLDELEVVGTINNLAIKVTTIDSIAQKELSLQDIGELLAAYSSVFVKSYGRGSLSTVSVRGAGASHTKVLWEGFNINSPMLGQTDFSLLPGSFFDEIELRYGGNSLTDVGGAIGGSVSLKSSDNLPENHFIIHQSIGSFNTYLTSASANFTKSKFTSTTRFIRQLSLNNFGYYNNAFLPYGKKMVQTDADFTVTGFTQKLLFNISDKQKISFISWNQWSCRNIPAIMTNIERGGNQQERNNVFSSRNVISWSLHNKITRWEVKGAYFYNNFNYFLSTEDNLGEPVSLINSANTVETYSTSLEASSNFHGRIILKVHTEMLYNQVVSSNYTGVKNQHNLIGYVSLKKSFNDRITMEGLVRSEISDAVLLPLMPMLSVVYKPFSNTNINIRANVSRNYNLPSLNDLYWYPGGNSALKPEESLQTEVGLNFVGKLSPSFSIDISSSTYASSISNWIIWLPSDYRYWSPQNIASVYARGAELSFHLIGSYRNLLIKFFGEYTYTRTTNNSRGANDDGISNIQLAYVPLHTSNGYVNISYSEYYANWSVSFTSLRNTSLNNSTDYSFTLPAYTLNNISVGRKFTFKNTQLNLKAKVYNIFNVDYQAVLWRAMPGRNFEFSLSFSI